MKDFTCLCCLLALAASSCCWGEPPEPAKETAPSAKAPPAETQPIDVAQLNAPGAPVPAPAGGGAQPPCPAPAPATAPPAATPADWVQHTDPLGFAVQHPRGWGVQTVSASAVAVCSPDKSAVALVVPFFAPAGATARQCLAQAPGFLAAILPQGRFVKAAQRSQIPDEVLASFAYDAGGRPGQAALLCSVFNRSGMLFVVAAPSDQYAAARPLLVRVLQSFRFTAPTAPQKGAPAAEEVKYVRWQDPTERAFSVEVPAGWKVTGGTIRRNAVDPRATLQAASPDGGVLISSGDAAVPVFKVPDGSPFFPEGSDYSPGYGVNMKVRRPASGADFAREYVQMKFGRTFTDMQLTGGRDRPDIAEAFNAIYVKYSSPQIGTRLSMGEITFTCKTGGQPLVGYWFAGTELTMTNMGGAAGGLWHVPHLIGFVATPQKAALAQSVLGHIVKSIQLNPEWVAMQQGLTANVSGIVAETNAAISGIIKQKFEHEQAVKDNAARNWSNMTLGQVDLADPATGQTYRAASGHNYYWTVPGSDTVAGTRTYDPPDINVVPLVEW